MGDTIKIFIADDHPVFRCGLKETLGNAPEFEILGETDHGEKAFASILQLNPEIAVLDVDMPGMSGLDIAERLKEAAAHIKVVILTSYKEESFFNRAMDLGVKGYILKDNAINDLTHGLLCVYRGEVYLSPSISSFLLKRAQRNEKAASNNTGFESLTPSELRVLRLVADNLTSKEIGNRLSVSPRTIDTHRNNICGKLELRGSRGLLLFARHDWRAFNIQGHTGLLALPFLLILCILMAEACALGATLTPSSGAVNTAIPDNDTNGITSVINVSGATDNITDVTVTLNLTDAGGGAFNGDYYAYLAHDTITGFAVLLNRPGKTAGNAVGTDGAGFTNVVFDDAAANGDVHVYETTLGGGFTNGDALTGTWAPDGRNIDPANVVDTDTRTALLSSFDGQLPNGDWELFIADMTSGGTLTLSDWSMEITVVPEPRDYAVLMGACLVFLGGYRKRVQLLNKIQS